MSFFVHKNREEKELYIDYLNELNLKENYEKAYDWYLKAANNGNVEAMFILAEAYNYEELDLDEDEDEAK